MTWLIYLIIGLAFQVLAYVLMPKTKTKNTVQKMEDPTASAGKRIPIIFGHCPISDPNLLWFGDKAIGTYTSSSGKK